MSCSFQLNGHLLVATWQQFEMTVCFGLTEHLYRVCVFLSGYGQCETVAVIRCVKWSWGSQCILVWTRSFLSRMEVHSARCLDPSAGDSKIIFFFLYWYHRRPKLHEMIILRSSDQGENILIFTNARLLGRLNTVKFSKNPYLASTVFRSCLTAYLGNVESHKWKWRRLYHITKNLL